MNIEQMIKIFSSRIQELETGFSGDSFLRKKNLELNKLLLNIMLSGSVDQKIIA